MENFSKSGVPVFRPCRRTYRAPGNWIVDQPSHTSWGKWLILGSFWSLRPGPGPHAATFQVAYPKKWRKTNTLGPTEKPGAPWTPVKTDYIWWFKFEYYTIWGSFGVLAATSARSALVLEVIHRLLTCYTH